MPKHGRLSWPRDSANPASPNTPSDNQPAGGATSKVARLKTWCCPPPLTRLAPRAIKAPGRPYGPTHPQPALSAHPPVHNRARGAFLHPSSVLSPRSRLIFFTKFSSIHKRLKPHLTPKTYHDNKLPNNVLLAGVTQWQSPVLVRRQSWVQFPSPAPWPLGWRFPLPPTQVCKHGTRRWLRLVIFCSRVPCHGGSGGGRPLNTAAAPGLNFRCARFQKPTRLDDETAIERLATTPRQLPKPTPEYRCGSLGAHVSPPAPHANPNERPAALQARINGNVEEGLEPVTPAPPGFTLGLTTGLTRPPSQHDSRWWFYFWLVIIITKGANGHSPLLWIKPPCKTKK